MEQCFQHSEGKLIPADNLYPAKPYIKYEGRKMIILNVQSLKKPGPTGPESSIIWGALFKKKNRITNTKLGVHVNIYLD